MNLYGIDYTILEIPPRWRNLLDRVQAIEGVFAVYPGGSRYIGGHTEDSDVDVVVFAQSKVGILKAGFEPHNDSYSNVRSFRKGNVNLIVLDTQDKWLQTVAATELCRIHGTNSKEMRYAIHETVKGETDG